ncbi:hypothetical protein NDU88_003976 [Pleurodeles waltl]|uniref:Uncharacterized protein n=1 Tax=Pleurodeles waltl TaxID=8319 RepID=A0AAV7UZZ6_PLEWA|nr:hypothetical protein NDU88_003976 [Pleurodeles waltl]
MDPSALLNATFSIFKRAMALAGAPMGPMEPLAFNLGVLPVPYKQAPFLPFMPTAPTSSEMTAPLVPGKSHLALSHSTEGDIPGSGFTGTAKDIFNGFLVPASVGRHSTPARRITRPAVVCAGILDVPAPLRLGPRRQSAPRARVSALPAALLGRCLRRARPQATRPPVPRGH